MTRSTPTHDALIIKRYGNRRLYDTESGGYLTNQDVIDIIRQGRDIRVVDSRTGEDMTKMVLVNIILEEEKFRQNLLPVSFLLQLIRLQGETLQDFFQNYLTATLEAYLRTRREFDRRFREWLDLGAALTALPKPPQPLTADEAAEDGDPKRTTARRTARKTAPKRRSKSPSKPS